MESVVELTHNLGPFHARVLRILRMKGFLGENAIQQMCLLPPRDTRAVINQLLSQGYIRHLEVPKV
jgi:hypothetical protein